MSYLSYSQNPYKWMTSCFVACLELECTRNLFVLKSKVDQWVDVCGNQKLFLHALMCEEIRCNILISTHLSVDNFVHPLFIFLNFTSIERILYYMIMLFRNMLIELAMIDRISKDTDNIFHNIGIQNYYAIF